LLFSHSMSALGQQCWYGKGQIPLDFLANHNVREQINRTLHDAYMQAPMGAQP
jgi:hypothetical protein